MKFKVLNEFENPLLERRQFTVLIEDVKKTPKRIEVLKQFSAKMGLDPKHVIVDTIYTETGTEKVKAYIKAYKDEKALLKIEVKNNIEKRKKLMEELFPKKEETEEKPKEETKEENKEKAEETKEEKKEEEKKE